jgi:glycosyltransferase involved in cell wall biosynthesis
MHPFTLVSTVFNEARRLAQTIADLEAQTVLPDEIIITDAGSTDGTFERLHEWRNSSKLNIRILQEARCNVARGRNLAIKAARNELIVSTDFGCRFHPDWLKSLVSAFENPEVKFVAGNFTILEDEVKSLAAKADYILSGGYDTQMDEYFVPSSRSVAYYREIWQLAGGYPEYLTLAADDTNFALTLRKIGVKCHYITDKNVFWMRHQTFRQFAREAFRYGLGDGESRINYRNFWSHVAETSCRYFLSVYFVLIFALWPQLGFWLLIPLPILLLGLRSYLNAFQRWLKLKSAKYHFGIFLVSLYLTERLRISYLQGYLKGRTRKSNLPLF